MTMETNAVTRSRTERAAESRQAASEPVRMGSEEVRRCLFRGGRRIANQGERATSI